MAVRNILTTGALFGKLMWLIAIRYDIFYAVKELSRSLTAPTQLDLAKLKRLLRYLRGTRSLIAVLRPQIQVALGSSLDINAFTDSDWAGCQKTRKSASGNCHSDLGMHCRCTITHSASFSTQLRRSRTLRNWDFNTRTVSYTHLTLPTNREV